MWIPQENAGGHKSTQATLQQTPAKDLARKCDKPVVAICTQACVVGVRCAQECAGVGTTQGSGEGGQSQGVYFPRHLPALGGQVPGDASFCSVVHCVVRCACRGWPQPQAGVGHIPLLPGGEFSQAVSRQVSHLELTYQPPISHQSATNW
eukprot:gene11784-biopygen15443